MCEKYHEYAFAPIFMAGKTSQKLTCEIGHKTFRVAMLSLLASY